MNLFGENNEDTTEASGTGDQTHPPDQYFHKLIFPTLNVLFCHMHRDRSRWGIHD